MDSRLTEAEGFILDAGEKSSLFTMPDKIFGLVLILDFIDRCHSLTSLYLPQAALGLVAIPNTEVKLMYADDSCRVTGRENR